MYRHSKKRPSTQTPRRSQTIVAAFSSFVLHQIAQQRHHQLHQARLKAIRFNSIVIVVSVRQMFKCRRQRHPTNPWNPSTTHDGPQTFNPASKVVHFTRNIPGHHLVHGVGTTARHQCFLAEGTGLVQKARHTPPDHTVEPHQTRTTGHKRSMPRTNLSTSHETSLINTWSTV